MNTPAKYMSGLIVLSSLTVALLSSCRATYTDPHTGATGTIEFDPRARRANYDLLEKMKADNELALRAALAATPPNNLLAQVAASNLGRIAQLKAENGYTPPPAGGSTGGGTTHS